MISLNYLFELDKNTGIKLWRSAQVRQKMNNAPSVDPIRNNSMIKRATRLSFMLKKRSENPEKYKQDLQDENPYSDKNSLRRDTNKQYPQREINRQEIKND